MIDSKISVLRMVAALLLGALVLAACGEDDPASPGAGNNAANNPAENNDPADAGNNDTPDADPEPVACPSELEPSASVAVTALGPLQGRTADGVSAFLNVPFTAPPVGSLRWRTPEAPGCYPPSGLDATEWGPMCPQLDESGALVGEEDCLQLNVWTPEGRAPNAALPVLFFIHGGGNIQGSAVQLRVDGTRLFDGALLASRFNAVVVTIQYRLASLGWLTLPELAERSADGARANFGTLDQIAALRWVQENIGALGGDPAQVLLFGESAGARNTCVLVASPLASDLFSAALMQSGACLVPTLEEVEAESVTLAEAAGCTGADRVACLEGLSVEAIYAALPPTLELTNLAGSSKFKPTPDGRVLLDQPERVIARGEHNHVPMVVGVNSEEMGASVPAIATEEQYEAAVRAALGPIYGPQALEVYPVSDYATPRQAMVALLSDANFVCNARRSARAAFRGQDAPVWRYYFTQNIEGSPRQAPLGAFHGLELVYLFQKLDIGGYRASAGEEQLALDMGAAWTRLAASGDPDDPAAPIWPRYDEATDPYVVLDGDGLSAGAGLRTVQCDFWDSFYEPLP